MEYNILLFAAVLALGVNWSSSLPRSSHVETRVPDVHLVSKRRAQYVYRTQNVIASCDDSYEYCSHLVQEKGWETTCTKWLSDCKKTCGACQVNEDCYDLLPIAVCQNARMWAVYCPMRKYTEGCFKTCCDCSLTNKNCFNS